MQEVIRFPSISHSFSYNDFRDEEQVQVEKREADSSFSFTFSKRDRLHQELLDAIIESSKDSISVDSNAFINAEKFINSISDSLSEPTISISQSGKIAFQWNGQEGDALVTFGKPNFLTYAIIEKGGNRQHGYEVCSGTFSGDLHEHLLQMYSE